MNDIPMKSVSPSTVHQEFYNAMEEVLVKFQHKVNPIEMLVLLSQLVGALVGVQDQRVLTPQMALDIIMRNMEVGNAQICLHHHHVEGNA
jgi:hypothetical protein